MTPEVHIANMLAALARSDVEAAASALAAAHHVALCCPPADPAEAAKLQWSLREAGRAWELYGQRVDVEVVTDPAANEAGPIIADPVAFADGLTKAAEAVDAIITSEYEAADMAIAAAACGFAGSLPDGCPGHLAFESLVAMLRSFRAYSVIEEIDAELPQLFGGGDR